MHSGIIKLIIEYRSTVVFDGIFDSRYGNDEDQRYRVDAWVDSTENGEELNSEFGMRQQVTWIIADLLLE